MKRAAILFFIFVFSCSLNLSAHVMGYNSSDIIQCTINACIAMHDAVAIGDSVAFMKSALEFRTNDVANFNSPSCKDDTMGAVDCYLVFDEAFAYNLAKGCNVYRHTEAMNTSLVLPSSSLSAKEK